MAATIAHGIIGAGEGGVHAVSIAADGTLEAVPASHPNFERRLVGPGYVGTVDSTTDVARLAARIRDAALANSE